MIVDDAEFERRARQAEEAVEALRRDGVRLIQLEMPDINGTMRGKLAGLGKGLSASGTGMSTLTMSFRSRDDFTLTEWSNVENGFPKMIAVADPTTAVRWPWRPDTAGVLCEFFMEDWSPCPMDGRHILRRVVKEYEDLGLEPRVAFEWEFYVYEADDEMLRTGRYHDLKSLGRQLHCYSITNFPSFQPLGGEFIKRMADVGVSVEAFHSEYGRGQFEFTCDHAPAIRAADDALRAKTYLKQLAAELGYVTTWMPAVHTTTADSRNGCHVNTSVWQDGANALWDASRGELSQLGRHAAAGIMATMPDFHLFFRPWINSFRRLDRLSWNPEDASWGLDNHSAGIRVVHGSNPPKYTRFEHRAAGPDTNPYLTAAAILYGGLIGIREKMEPPELAVGDPVEAGRYAMLPRTLSDSVTAFRESSHARALLGDLFVEHFAALKSDEWQDYEAWAKERDGLEDVEVSKWEFDHYFEWV